MNKIELLNVVKYLVPPTGGVLTLITDDRKSHIYSMDRDKMREQIDNDFDDAGLHLNLNNTVIKFEITEEKV